MVNLVTKKQNRGRTSEKTKELVGNYTFGIELTDKATEQDYYDYIKFVTNYTGTQNMFPI